jgi:hypothetical protein
VRKSILIAPRAYYCSGVNHLLASTVPQSSNSRSCQNPSSLIVTSSPSAPDAYRSLISSAVLKRFHEVSMNVMRLQCRLQMGGPSSISGPSWSL